MRKWIISVSCFILLHITLLLMVIFQDRIGIGGYHVHFISSFVIALMGLYILMHEHLDNKNPYLIVFLYSLCLAFGVELYQLMVGRFFDYTDVLDVCYSVLGTVFAVGIGTIVGKTKLHKKKAI